MATITRTEVKELHKELDTLLTDFFKKHNMTFLPTGSRFNDTEFKMSVKAVRARLTTGTLTKVEFPTMANLTPGMLRTSYGTPLTQEQINNGNAAIGSVLWIRDRGTVKAVTIENAAKTCYHIVMTAKPGAKYRIHFTACFLTEEAASRR